jgi:hypothetical protein
MLGRFNLRLKVLGATHATLTGKPSVYRNLGVALLVFKFATLVQPSLTSWTNNPYITNNLG